MVHRPGAPGLLTCLLLATALPVAAMPASAAASDGSGFVTTPDGVRIHYVERGSGPAILFVPGWTMTAAIWEPQLAYFSKSRRAVAIDPRAQGDSTKTSDGLYPAARARDIKAVVDQLKLAPVVLVGWSQGVAEVAAYVDQFGTGTLSAIVLVDGSAGTDFDPVRGPAMLQYAGRMQIDRATMTKNFVRSMYRRPQSEAYLEQVVADSMKTPTASAVALFVGLITTDLRPALAGFDRPTLLAVAGGGPWMAVYEDMRARIPSCRMEVFENAGHALFVDDAQKFNALLDGFLSR